MRRLIRSITVPTLLLTSLWCYGAEDSLEVLSKNYSYESGEFDGTTFDDSVRGSDSFRGQFRPVNFTVLSAGIDGKLKRFDIKTGSTLKKGDLIAKFLCSEEQAEYAIAVARVKVSTKNVEVNKKLAAYQNISELDLSKSEAELEIANAEAARTKAVVGKCSIFAPFDATVTEKLAQAHQYVQKGDPLLEIVDTRNLEIEMVLPSVDVNRYEAGREFTILIDETGLETRAQVDRVVNVIDPVSQTIRVIGTLAEQAPGLMPGMSGVIHFH